MPTRIWIIGLGLRFCLMQPVEIEPGLPSNRGGCGEIEDRPRTFLDRAQWPHPRPPHQACVHVSREVKAGDRDAGTLERSPAQGASRRYEVAIATTLSHRFSRADRIRVRVTALLQAGYTVRDNVRECADKA